MPKFFKKIHTHGIVSEFLIKIMTMLKYITLVSLKRITIIIFYHSFNKVQNTYLYDEINKIYQYHKNR